MRAVNPLPVAVVSPQIDVFDRAIESGGGTIVDAGENPRGLVWSGDMPTPLLKCIVEDAPNLHWVQLPSAGIEAYIDIARSRPDIRWTSAKGAFAEPVAEHALALTLACLRLLPMRARSQTWGTPAGSSLHGLSVLILGAGGIASELIRLLRPFHTRITVVRRNGAIPAEGAAATVSSARLLAELPNADVVILCAALTPQTRHLIGRKQLEAMKSSAVLVNIARGGLVDTDALVDVLQNQSLFGVGLDVTDPEPLADGHPLWDIERVIITPHTADTPEMVRDLLANRIETNIRLILSGQEPVGMVDLDAGY